MSERRTQLLEQLELVGATKLSWSVEIEDVEGHQRWVCTIQAANEMGAPVELPVDMVAELEQMVHTEWNGVHTVGVWSMDVLSGHVSAIQPRPGDGAGAPGIAERTP